MSKSHREIKFPTEKPMKEMEKILDAASVDNIQIIDKKGADLLNVPARLNAGRRIPKTFKMPIKAAGFGVSIVAKLLGIRIIVDSIVDNVSEDK
jgi:hypothetical protein